MGGSKMSKSKGNVAGPDELVEQYGADAMRLYILFMGPADQDMEWTESGIEGISRFVRRLWRIVHEVAEQAPTEGDDGVALPSGQGDAKAQTGGEAGAVAGGPLVRSAHATIAKVTDDIDRRFQFHTPISAVMELVNELADDVSAPGARFAAETAVSLIQPYAPHVAEELWGALGRDSRLWEEPWPVADPALLERETFELVIQVNGKLRDRIEVPAGLGEAELVARAQASPKVQAHLDGREIRQTVVVPGKLVNLVVG